jgi:hypothetical protein
MNVLDQASYLAEKELSKHKAKSLKEATVWFVSEIVQMLVLIIGAILLLWFYAPFSILWKFLLTFLSLIIVFDVYKSFIYVRWILIKGQFR